MIRAHRQPQLVRDKGKLFLAVVARPNLDARRKIRRESDDGNVAALYARGTNGECGQKQISVAPGEIEISRPAKKTRLDASDFAGEGLSARATRFNGTYYRRIERERKRDYFFSRFSRRKIERRLCNTDCKTNLNLR